MLSAAVSSAAAVFLQPPRRGGALLLRSLGGRHLLFSELQQTICELDDLSAYAWRSLDGGLSRDRMVRELVEAGMPPDEAARAISASLKELEAIRAAEAAPLPTKRVEPTERLTSLTLGIAGVAVQLHLSSALVGDVGEVFGHLRSDAAQSDVQLCARLAGDRVDFLPPGAPAESCEPAEFVPLLKAQLVEDVLRCARYEVALHAAALVRGDRVLLLVGAPGAGKTTLGIALVQAGFELAADDVALVDGDGMVLGLPFPFAAKAGSWPLIARHWPDARIGPIYRRPDGRRVRFLLPDRLASSVSRRIGAVVLLDRRDGAGTCVRNIDPVDALGALIAEGASRDALLGVAGFVALVDALGEARCCRLTYDDLLPAADALVDLCS